MSESPPQSIEHTAANQLTSFYLKQRTARGFCAAQRVKLPSCRSHEPSLVRGASDPTSEPQSSLPSIRCALLSASSQGRKNEITQSEWWKRSRTVFLFLPTKQEGKWNGSPWIMMVLRWLFQSWLKDSQGHMTLRPVWKWPLPWSPMARAQRV